MLIGSNGQTGGRAISKLGCAFPPARGRGRRLRLLVAAAREGKAVSAAARVEASSLEVGEPGWVSSSFRPFRPFHIAAVSASLSLEGET